MATEIIKIVGQFLLNPVLWTALLAAVAIGYFRVKRERQLFRTRVIWGWTEFAGLLKNGLLPGLILSVLISGIGLAVPAEWLIALAAVSVIWLISGLYQLGSFVYLASGAVLIVWAFAHFGLELDLGFFAYSGTELTEQWLLAAALITGLFVIAEGLLIKRHGAYPASPRLQKTARGLKAAVYRSKRLWLLPVLFVVPGDWLPAASPYWPQLTLGQETFTFLLFPAVFGFGAQARRTLPLYLYPKLGGAVMMLGAGMLLVSAAGFFYPPAALIALAGGAAVRLLLTLLAARQERRGAHAVSPQSEGVMIVDILPDSPADKMGLVRGEVIRKVNGIPVRDEKTLYEAIQVNAAHCRLEVLDHAGELRLRQHVVFRHDHHRLGLIVLN